MLISDSRFDLVWFRLSCDHGCFRSGSVNVRKQQQQLYSTKYSIYSIPARNKRQNASFPPYHVFFEIWMFRVIYINKYVTVQVVFFLFRREHY